MIPILCVNKKYKKLPKFQYMCDDLKKNDQISLIDKFRN